MTILVGKKKTLRKGIKREKLYNENGNESMRTFF
ncbi:unnamed protein product [Arabidopsis halleri]